VPALESVCLAVPAGRAFAYAPRMSSALHITHLKLDWLRRRREELRAQYEAITARANATEDPTARVDALRAGLAALRAGSELLHPESQLLEDVIPLGATSVAMATWRARLEQELAWGRARAEYGWLFAGLIEEWVATAEAAIARAEARCAAAEPVRGKDSAFDLAIVDELFTNPEIWDPVRVALAEVARKEASEAASSYEVETALDAIANGPYRSHALRRQARQVTSDHTLRSEYTSAVSLMIDGSMAWDWPATGVPARVVEAIDRFRTYLEPELLDALFLEVVGTRWSDELATRLAAATRPTAHPGDELVDRLHETLDEQTWLPPFITVNQTRGSSHYVSADAVFDAPDAFEEWLAKLHTRIHGLRAIHPDAPVYVVVADIAAMGPSLPHEVLDRVAAGVGIPDSWRTFIARYLAVPVRDAAGGVARCRRGIFPDQRLAIALAETALAAIEARIREVTHVQVIRLLDDFAFVTHDPAALASVWALFRRLLAAVGLTLNPEKSRAMVVFGDAPLPPDLPAGPIRAGHLELGRDGAWTIDRAAVAHALAETRARVHACASVFEAAQVFSDCVRVALRRMSPFAVFEVAHVREVARAIACFYDELEGPGAGIVAHLVSRMKARMPDVDATSIASGVWYWPRTAGGVGLFDATAQLAALHSAWRATPPLAALPRELTEDKLEAFMRSLKRRVRAPRQPPCPPEVEARIVDFVRRGAELRGEELDEDTPARQLRHELNFYWQWVVAIHGPTVLDRFGTFRFVEASRVPFGAIVELGWLGSSRG
jgi:hypothetical protein